MKMKLTMNRIDLQAGLRTVQGAVGGKNLMRVLNNVRAEARKAEDGETGGKLKLTATNLETTISVEVNADVSVPGDTTIPVKILSSIVNSAYEGAVDIEVDGEDIAHVTSGRAGFKIGGIPSSDFPVVPQADGKFRYTMKTADLKRLLRRTAYAQSTDPTRKTLMGLLLELDGTQMTAVATDGRRLALDNCEVIADKPAKPKFDNGKVQFVIPSPSVGTLTKFLEGDGEVVIESADSQLTFITDTGAFTTVLLDTAFPNYMQVIPKDAPCSVKVDRAALITTIARVSAVNMAALSDSNVRIVVENGQMIVEVKGDDMCEARDTLPVKADEGAKVNIVFNPAFLLDPLKAVDADEMVFHFGEKDTAPATITVDGEDFVTVLMPLRSVK